MPLRQSGGVEGSSGVAALGGKQPATGGKMYSSFGGKKRPVPRPMGGKKMKTPMSCPIMGGKTLPAAAAAMSSHGGKLQPPAGARKKRRYKPGTVALRVPATGPHRPTTSLTSIFAPFKGAGRVAVILIVYTAPPQAAA